MQSAKSNRRMVLAKRPRGEPDESTLRLESGERPEAGDGEMLLRTVWLSLDPYMRGRMNDAPSYAKSVDLGETMVGGTVARVVTSTVAGFAEGDWVLNFSGWQDYALSNGEGVLNLGAAPKNPSWALGVLGMPGFTAWAGLREIGRPKAGETLVVAAATGPVGGTVGQLARIQGLRAVGVAGGPEKCARAVDELGFDACVDHRADGLAARLANETPDGIDIYFENVGGKVLDAVIPRLNPNARVPVCGLVSQYNATALPDGPDRMNWLMSQILVKRATFRGFIIFNDFGHLYPEFANEVTPLVEGGSIRYREEVVDGLENALPAFAGLLRGESVGKRVVRVGPDG